MCLMQQTFVQIEQAYTSKHGISQKKGKIQNSHQPK